MEVLGRMSNWWTKTRDDYVRYWLAPDGKLISAGKRDHEDSIPWIADQYGVIMRWFPGHPSYWEEFLANGFARIGIEGSMIVATTGKEFSNQQKMALGQLMQREGRDLLLQIKGGEQLLIHNMEEFKEFFNRGQKVANSIPSYLGVGHHVQEFVDIWWLDNNGFHVESGMDEDTKEFKDHPLWVDRNPSVKYWGRIDHGYEQVSIAQSPHNEKEVNKFDKIKRFLVDRFPEISDYKFFVYPVKGSGFRI